MNAIYKLESKITQLIENIMTIKNKQKTFHWS